jgi:hypothetical protein
MEEKYQCKMCKEWNSDEHHVHSIKFTAKEGSILGEGNEYELNICESCLMDQLGNYMRVTNV